MGDDDVEESNWEKGYQHRCFTPLPLPPALREKMDQVDMTALPFMGTSKVDILVENASSTFIDVRHDAWQELANATDDESTVEALLETSIHDEDCISLGTAVLREDSKYELTADTKRCVLKTLLNIVETRDVDACRKISALKVDINKLAEDVGNSAEARSTATRLIQCLA